MAARHGVGHSARRSGALALKDIAAEVMARRRLDPSDARTARLVHKLINNALTQQATELVEKIVEDGLVRWRVRR